MDDPEFILLEEVKYVYRSTHNISGDPYYSGINIYTHHDGQYKMRLNNRRQDYSEVELVRKEIIKVIDCRDVVDIVRRKIGSFGRRGGPGKSGQIDPAIFPFDKIKLMIQQADAANALEKVNKNLLYEMVRNINELRDKMTKVEDAINLLSCKK